MDKQRRLIQLSPFLQLCLVGALAIFSSTMAKNPALPLFMRSLGVSQATIGFVAAASTVVGVVVSLPAGILSDLCGRRRVLLASAFVFASAPFLYLFVRSPWQLVVVRVYHGLATAILGPIALAAVADTYQAGQGEKMAWYSSATMVGRFLAPSVGGLLIAASPSSIGSSQGFHWVYLGCGVAGLLTLALAVSIPLAERRPRDVSGPTWAETWRHFRDEAGYVAENRRLLTISLVQAAQYFAFGFLEVYLPLRLVDAGLKSWQIGPLFTVQILLTAVSKPAMGRLSDRFGRAAPITGGLVLGALGVVLLSATTNYALLLLSSGLFGLGLAAVTAATAAMAADLARGSSRGAAMGILSSIMDVGQSTGPMAGGLLVSAFGYSAAFVGVAALLGVTATVLTLVIRGR